MLKDNSQKVLDLSPYQGLYEAIIPRDHILRRLKDSIDFSFVNPMMRKQYCENFGRPAKEPEMMFKLLFLKKLYNLSDEQLISRAQTDMAYAAAPRTSESNRPCSVWQVRHAGGTGPFYETRIYFSLRRRVEP